MILGHEVSAYVQRLGEGVAGLSVGQLVAVSPSRPCRSCRFCQQGLHNQCLNMRFYGSAMPFPHIQGAFREELVAEAIQCVPADGLTAGEAAMAEPLAVSPARDAPGRRTGRQAGSGRRLRADRPALDPRRPAGRRRRNRRDRSLRFHAVAGGQGRRRPGHQYGQAAGGALRLQRRQGHVRYPLRMLRRGRGAGRGHRGAQAARDHHPDRSGR